jgi:hypothetical protein
MKRVINVWLKAQFQCTQQKTADRLDIIIQFSHGFQR